jgi:hypothetical protein
MDPRTLAWQQVWPPHRPVGPLPPGIELPAPGEGAPDLAPAAPGRRPGVLGKFLHRRRADSH